MNLKLKALFNQTITSKCKTLLTKATISKKLPFILEFGLCLSLCLGGLIQFMLSCILADSFLTPQRVMILDNYSALLSSVLLLGAIIIMSLVIGFIAWNLSYCFKKTESYLLKKFVNKALPYAGQQYLLHIISKTDNQFAIIKFAEELIKDIKPINVELAVSLNQAVSDFINNNDAECPTNILLSSFSTLVFQIEETVLAVDKYSEMERNSLKKDNKHQSFLNQLSLWEKEHEDLECEDNEVGMEKELEYDYKQHL